MTRLELAMLAGAYAITNSRFGKNGGTYVKGVFSPNPEKIPFGEAAKVLSDTSCDQNVFVCPVKPGQTVYQVNETDGTIYECKIEYIFFTERCWTADCTSTIGFDADAWGELIFPTREAAEKKLEEFKS